MTENVVHIGISQEDLNSIAAARRRLDDLAKGAGKSSLKFKEAEATLNGLIAKLNSKFPAAGFTDIVRTVLDLGTALNSAGGAYSKLILATQSLSAENRGLAASYKAVASSKDLMGGIADIKAFAIIEGQLTRELEKQAAIRATLAGLGSGATSNVEAAEALAMIKSQNAALDITALRLAEIAALSKSANIAGATGNATAIRALPAEERRTMAEANLAAVKAYEMELQRLGAKGLVTAGQLETLDLTLSKIKANMLKSDLKLVGGAGLTRFGEQLKAATHDYESLKAKASAFLETLALEKGMQEQVNKAIAAGLALRRYSAEAKASAFLETLALEKGMQEQVNKAIAAGLALRRSNAEAKASAFLETLALEKGMQEQVNKAIAAGLALRRSNAEAKASAFLETLALEKGMQEQVNKAIAAGLALRKQEALSRLTASSNALAIASSSHSTVSGSQLADLKAQNVAYANAAASAGALSRAEAANIAVKNGLASAIISTDTHTNRLTRSTRTLHDAFRGLAGATGNLWLSYGQMLPLMAGFAAGATALGAAKLGTEFEFATKYVDTFATEAERATMSLGSMRERILEIKGVTDSPDQLADALKEMTKAGFDASSSMDSLGVMSKVAYIAQEELSKVTSSAIQQFRAWGDSAVGSKRGVESVTEAASLMGYAVIESAMNMEDLMTMLKHTSGMAATTNLSFTELLATLATMSNMGLGVTAATALRGAMKRLIDPSKEVAQIFDDIGFKAFSGGKLKEQATLFEDLARSLKDLPEQERLEALNSIFELRAMEGGAAMLKDFSKNLDGAGASIRKMVAEMEEQAKTDEWVNTKFAALTDNTRSQISLLLADVRRELIKSFDSGALRKLVDELSSAVENGGVAKFVDAITGLADIFYRSIAFIVEYSGAIGSLLKVMAGGAVGVFVGMLWGVAQGASAATIGIKALNVVMAVNPWLAAGAAIAAVALAFLEVSKNSKETAKGQEAWNKTLSNSTYEELPALLAKVDELQAARKKLSEESPIKSFFSIGSDEEDVGRQLNRMADRIDHLKKTITEIAEAKAKGGFASKFLDLSGAENELKEAEAAYVSFVNKTSQYSKQATAIQVGWAESAAAAKAWVQVQLDALPVLADESTAISELTGLSDSVKGFFDGTAETAYGATLKLFGLTDAFRGVIDAANDVEALTPAQMMDASMQREINRIRAAIADKKLTPEQREAKASKDKLKEFNPEAKMEDSTLYAEYLQVLSQLEGSAKKSISATAKAMKETWKTELETAESVYKRETQLNDAMLKAQMIAEDEHFEAAAASTEALSKAKLKAAQTELVEGQKNLNLQGASKDVIADFVTAHEEQIKSLMLDRDLRLEILDIDRDRLKFETALASIAAQGNLKSSKMELSGASELEKTTFKGDVGVNSAKAALEGFKTTNKSFYEEGSAAANRLAELETAYNNALISKRDSVAQAQWKIYSDDVGRLRLSEEQKLKYVEDAMAATIITERDAAQQRAFITGDMYKAILLTTEQYLGSIKPLAESMSEAWASALSQLSDELNNFMWGADTSFGSIAESFTKMITKMVLETQVIKPLLEGLMTSLQQLSTASSSSGLLGILGAAIGGLMGSGSTSTILPSYTIPSSTNFSGVSLFSAAGGYDVPSGVNPITQLHEREMVLPAEYADIIRNGFSSGGQGSVTVNVINKASSARATTTEQTDNQGNKTINVIIDQIKSSIAGDITSGNGIVPNALGATYGLNRVAGAW